MRLTATIEAVAKRMAAQPQCACGSRNQYFQEILQTKQRITHEPCRDGRVLR